MLKSRMRSEIEEIPQAVQRLLTSSNDAIREAAEILRSRPPTFVATIARGSSDHAAAYLKYCVELIAGIPVASIGPSIISVYGREMTFQGAAAIAISQSGRSPDIVSTTQSARRNGAWTLALTNTADSPLAGCADLSLDLAAGAERSVAATKSFVNSVVAGLAVLAHWQQDRQLIEALEVLPSSLARAIELDWSALDSGLKGRSSLFVLGRGPAFALAQEAALKFKETCGLHAEAYSAAEVLHGPARIVEAGFPVIAFAAHDAAETSVAEIADRLGGQGARVFATTELVHAATTLQAAFTGHALTDALPLIVSFYAFVEALSRRLGYDPDHPPHLNKVTQTT